MPVMYAAAGNCHVYVHADADLEMARRIASTRRSSAPGSATRPRRCSSTPPSRRVPARRLADLPAPGSSWSATSGRAPRPGIAVGEASEEDWATEFLDLKMAVGVVDSLDEAIEHVNRSRHRPLGGDRHRLEEAAERFTDGVDAAVVYTNASTRFTDGFEFGMGAEIGNSTQKLHARGPIGLRELTTYKYVVRGDGQMRE